MPASPMGMLEYLRDRLARDPELPPQTVMSRQDVATLNSVVAALSAQMSDPDQRLVWRECLSERDGEDLARWLRRLQRAASELATGAGTAAALQQLVDQVLSNVNWCLEGLGRENDLQALLGHLTEVDIEDTQRQVLLARRITQVLWDIDAETRNRLSRVVHYGPTDDPDLRSRLPVMERGLREVLSKIAKAQLELDLYHTMLEHDIFNQNQPGFSRYQGEQQTVNAMHGRNRSAVRGAVVRVQAVLGALPAMPLEGSEQGLYLANSASFGTLVGS